VADSRIDELRRRLERDPASRLFAQLAEEHRKAGNHAEAVRVARTGLAQHPSYASARLTLGRALLDSGDAGGARVELEAALRDAPDNILASRFLGQALEALGELGPALLQLQKTLKMAPGDRQLESQIVALETRLRTPSAAGSAPAQRPPASELTTPIRPLAPPLAAADADEQALPPTIRIHMPGDPAPGAARRAAAPPLARPPVAPPPLPVAPPPLPSGPVGGGPPTAPATPAPNSEARSEAPAPRLAAEPFYESDVAPTQPKAEPSPFFVPEEPPEPTLPGSIAPVEEAPLAAEPASPALEVPAEPRETPAPVAEEAPSPGADPEAAAAPVPTSTLAELYLKQGLLDQAIDVYRQVVAAEPTNERARVRLVDLVASATAPDSRAARRRALERTIAGLEALLAVVRAPR
jgi:tetratricopeptide (TPR) repeat protein